VKKYSKDAATKLKGMTFDLDKLTARKLPYERLDQLLSLGARRENIWVSDIEGVVYEGRKTLMDQWKAAFAQKTDKRSLAEIVPGADIFLGLSAGNVLKVEMLKHMARDPLILALANPTPEIDPQAEAIPTKKIIKVDQAGHWLHHDQLELFLRETKAFLA
jgi:pimeloyl-ACP methyl ester carboxylesterase